ncbi:MAG TPA: hypothetical protein VMF68_11400 [Spirochaetia bacterium]|nr:hypothetical protein [Spirochaetia bacterium]HTZ52259.1 hypothetical protein [Spirochaetia bacterium]
MIRPLRLAVLAAAVLAGVLVLASCASGPEKIPPGLSAVDIFQRAQDASDRGDYQLAIRYYSLIATEYPDDVNHLTWATYEIAFLYHKMGKDAVALARINELLDQYASQGDKLPPAPRVLAAKLRTRLEAAVKSAPGAVAGSSSPGATDTPAAGTPATGTPADPGAQ